MGLTMHSSSTNFATMSITLFAFGETLPSACSLLGSGVLIQIRVNAYDDWDLCRHSERVI